MNGGYAFMKKTLGEKITAARESLGLSQHDVAKFMTSKGISVTNQKISKWETNYTTPNAYQFLALCEVLEIDDVLGTFGENSINSPLMRLNAEGNKKVQEYIELLIASGMFSNDTSSKDNVIYMRTLPLYDLPVSAGTGKYLDSDTCEMIKVGPEVPEEADFGVRISGDSMEPQFTDGQVVWVHKQEVIEDGEIGIFAFEENSYCKKFFLEDGKVELISLNPSYKPIVIPENKELICFGKVVF